MIYNIKCILHGCHTSFMLRMIPFLGISTGYHILYQWITHHSMCTQRYSLLSECLQCHYTVITYLCYEYTHTRVHIHTYTHMHMYMHTHTHTYTHARTHTHTHSTSIHTPKSTGVHIHTCMRDAYTHAHNYTTHIITYLSARPPF